MAIKFTGSNAQNIDLAGRAMADSVEVDKASGTVTLTGDFGAASLVLTDGDWTTSTFDVTVNGDVSFNDAAATVNMGTGSLWTIDGNFDPYTAGITFNRETSTIKLTGSGKTWYGGYSTCYYNKVWIAADASITITNSAVVWPTIGGVGDEVVIDGTLDVDAYTIELHYDSGIEVGASGILNSSAVSWGRVVFYYNTIGVIQMDGTWNAEFRCVYPDGMTIVPATYGDNGATDRFQLRLGTGYDTFVFPAGTTSINMELEIEQTGATAADIDLATNDAAVDLYGDLNAFTSGAGSIAWSQGTGNLSFRGGVAQTCYCEPTMDDIVINKTAETVTLTNDFSGTNITGTAGSFDADAYDVDLSDSGIFDFTTLSMGEGTWTIDGSFDCVDCNTVNQNDALLKLTGTGTFNTGTKYINSLWVTSTATITIAGTYGRVGGTAGTPTCVIDGTMILTYWLLPYKKCQVTVNATANISGAFGIYVYFPTDGGGIVSYSASATVTMLYLYFNYSTSTAVLVPADYSSISGYVDFNCQSAAAAELTLSSGTYTFYNVYFRETASGSMTINNDTNNPNIVITRYLQLSGDNLTWTKGTGTVTFSGSTIDGYIATQSNQIENVVVAKTGGRLLYVYQDSTIGGNLTVNGCNLKFDTYDYSLTVYGNVTFDATATLTMGDATSFFNVYGNFDNSASTVSNLTANTGTLVMKGTSKTLKVNATTVENHLYSLTIDTGASITLPTSYTTWVYDGNFKVYGTITLDSPLLTYDGAKTYVYSTGVITGSSYFYISYPDNGCGVLLADGTIAPGSMYFRLQAENPTAILTPGDYTGVPLFVIHQNYAAATGLVTWVPSSGTYKFDDLLVRTYSGAGGLFEIDNTTNDPNWEIAGDFTVTNLNGGTTTWTPGTGYLKFNGSSAQAMTIADTSPSTYERIIVDKTNTLTLTSNSAIWFLTSFTLVAGNFSHTTSTSLVAPAFILGGSGSFTQNYRIYTNGDWDDTAHTGTQSITRLLTRENDIDMDCRASGTDCNRFDVNANLGNITVTMTAGMLDIANTLYVASGCSFVHGGGTINGPATISSPPNYYA